MLLQLYKCFQRWSADGSVYIYSDPHFEDSDCKLMSEDWPTPIEQIEIINKKVHKGDTLIILGDIGNPEWIKQIKAHYKILIAGNHDAGLTNYTDYFDEVYGGPLFIGEKILLSHEPVDNECWYNLHGHRHSDNNTNYRGENYFNCCANVIKYEPINLKDIVNSGVLKNIPTIHRKTIDIASSK